MNMEKQVATIIAELCITIMGVFALIAGVDGAVFVSVIVSLAGLGGYHLKTVQKL